MFLGKSKTAEFEAALGVSLPVDGRLRVAVEGLVGEVSAQDLDGDVAVSLQVKRKHSAARNYDCNCSSSSVGGVEAKVQGPRD